MYEVVMLNGSILTIPKKCLKSFVLLHKNKIMCYKAVV